MASSTSARAAEPPRAKPPEEAPRRVAPPRLAGQVRERHVSAQAYYHAMLAELALARNELVLAADQLRLALVYDGESPHLTRSLARVTLKLGLVDKAARLAARALELDSTSAEAWLITAHVQLARGQNAAAERSLGRATAQEPGAVAPAIELARLWAGRGRSRDAVALLLRTADHAPKSVEPLVELANIEVSRRRLTAAASALERALARDPRNTAVATSLGGIYERQARYDEAAQAWRRVVELIPGDVEALFQSARAELWADRDDLAERAVLAIQAQQRGLELDVRLGMMFLEEGRPARAVELLGSSIRVAPADQRARFAYAIALAQLGRDEAALAELELISPEHELYTEARTRIATLLLGLGRFDRVRLAVGMTREKSLDAPGLVVLQAAALERSDRREDALTLLRGARLDAPSEAELAEAEAATLIRAGDRDRGMRGMRAFVESLVAPSDEALERLAAVYERAGEPELAIGVYEKMLQDSGESSRALGELGRLLLERPGPMDRAEKLLRRALALDPRSGAVLDSLGTAAARRGKLELAERLLRRAAKLLPNEPEVLEHLADVMLARAELGAARRFLGSAAALLERASAAREPGVEPALLRVRKKLSELPSPARGAP